MARRRRARPAWRVRRARAGCRPPVGEQRDQRGVRVLALADRARNAVVGAAGSRGTTCGWRRRAAGSRARPARRGSARSSQLWCGSLAKPSPGSSTIRARGMPAASAASSRSPSSRRTVSTTPSGRVVGEVAHPVGVGAPVHRDVDRVAAGDHVEDAGVGQPAGDVVDDPGAGRERGLGDLGAHRVDRDEGTGGGQLADHRDDAVELLGDHRPGGTGAGGLATDVEDVGARRRGARGRARPRTRWCRSGRRRRSCRG